MLDRFFCAGSTGYLNKDVNGDLLKREDVNSAILAILGLDRDFAEQGDTIEKLRAELAEAVVLVERIGKCLGEPCYAFYGEIRDFLAKHKEHNDEKR